MFHLYFIAIIPDVRLCKEITEIKKYFANNYFTKAALKLPPHITLYPPFRWDDKNENLLTVSSNNFIQGKAPFSIFLNGFGCFEPKVIFIKPEFCNKLNVFRNDLLLHLKSTINLSDPQNERSFHPHITLASRDLKKEFFLGRGKNSETKSFWQILKSIAFHFLNMMGRCGMLMNSFFFHNKTS